MRDMWKLCRIGKEYEFCAAHRLPFVKPSHQCSRVHGHNYKVEIEVRNEVLTANYNASEVVGFCGGLDFAEIDNQVKPVISRLDHKYLNDIDGLENPTAENIASYILKEVNSTRSIFYSVKVWETPKCWAMVINSDGLYRKEHKE